MKAFGVQFEFTDAARFKALFELFREIRRDKQFGEFRNPGQWIPLVPESVRGNFIWPTAKEREHWLSIRDSVCIAINAPSRQVGSTWDFYRVFEAIESAEYNLLECEMTAENTGEMRIDPWAYPYGGVGPFIALAEAFGFTVLGVNEHGKYETRDELLGGRGS